MALASGQWLEKEMRGEAPCPRHGHALAMAGNVAFLFGGASSINQEDNPVYFNDFYMLTVSPDDMTWEEIPQNGEVPSAREGHTLCVVKGKLYLFGGASSPVATECLPGVYSFDIVSLTWECLAIGGVALRSLRHSVVAVGDNIYVYGGILGGNPTSDLMVFNTVSLTWTPVKTGGLLPPALRGATIIRPHPSPVTSGSTHRPEPVIRGQPKIRGAMVSLRLVMKEILSEFGLQGVSHSFTPTKVPNVRYELSDAPSNQSRNTATNAQVFVHRDFSAVQDQAMKMIQTAFTLLDQEFQKLDREKSELSKTAAAVQREKEANEVHRQQQQQELQEMLDKHRSQNQAWLRTRAEENDRERRELCRLREEVLQEQERLKEEQSSIQKRSEHLLSIMQQFKGM
ncbi:uncharacterized protein [Pagrus major]|uniref:uncharacterized protein n=1 Tax=Pagrus major TaxID=143350 RepID=UPI003CC8C0A4